MRLTRPFLENVLTNGYEHDGDRDKISHNYG
jgi:hypothetical protein